ncbi:MAG TPA: dTDP-glucose 4,6-dehydratase [Thermomicrobiales bacterium]|nr:dTDP-glucose 4,6-dehydratase [Thermomicrobiales bacterium]
MVREESIVVAERQFRRVMVTGGAGFIGSNFVHYLLETYPAYRVVVVDKLTYAGNLANLADLEGDPRYSFVQADIADTEAIDRAMQGCDAVVNFAADSHVDRSLHDPGGFIQTDVFGVWVLLEAARRHGVARFLQVSTDEVYGHLPAGGASREDDRLRPRNPYSAAKAGGEMMVNAYVETHGLDAVITRGSNTFGPYQYPEKFMPLMITNALEDRPLPIYGDGQQRRDWLYVRDHCSGIALVLHRGATGEAYNVGGGNEQVNLDVARLILDRLGKPHSLLQHVADRPGHDRRYALDTAKTEALGWEPRHDFSVMLAETIDWYAAREDWWRPIKAGEFAEWYAKNYATR